VAETTTHQMRSAQINRSKTHKIAPRCF